MVYTISFFIPQIFDGAYFCVEKTTEEFTMRTIQTLINNGCAIRGVPIRLNGTLFFVECSVLSCKKNFLKELIVLKDCSILHDPQNLVVDEKELSKINK